MLDQVATQSGLTFRQLVEQLKQLDVEVKALDARVAAAKQAGQPAVAEDLLNERTSKSKMGLHIKNIFVNHFRSLQANQNSATTTANADGAQPDNQPVPGPSREKSATGAPEDHRIPLSDAQSLAHFWQSRGGTVNMSPAGTHQQGTNQPVSMPPEFAAQMQKLVDRQGIRPQSFGLVSQPSITGDAGANPSATSAQPESQPLWRGTFGCVTPETTGQGSKEVQVQIIALPPQPGGNLYACLYHQLVITHPIASLAHTWPKNMTLKFCKEPLRDPQEISAWVKGHQASLVRFIANPHVSDRASNDQSFASLIKLMENHHIVRCIPDLHGHRQADLFCSMHILGGLYRMAIIQTTW